MCTHENSKTNEKTARNLVIRVYDCCIEKRVSLIYLLERISCLKFKDNAKILIPYTTHLSINGLKGVPFRAALEFDTETVRINELPHRWIRGPER